MDSFLKSVNMHGILNFLLIIFLVLIYFNFQVPFGEVNFVKNWLKIEGDVKQPSKVHEQRPIQGLKCARKEVS